MKYTITIQKKHHSQLKNHLIQVDCKERVAFIVCGRSSVNNIEERFLTKEVHIIYEYVIDGKVRASKMLQLEKQFTNWTLTETTNLISN